MNKREELARVPLFAKLEPRFLDRLAELSVPKTYPADSLLIKEGTVGLGMFVIASGRVEVYKGEGDQRTTLSILGAGSIVGEMALIDEQYRSANVRSLEPTECLLLSRDAFNTLMRQDSDIAMAIMSVLAERICATLSKMHELQANINQTVKEAKEPLEDLGSAEQPSPFRDDRPRTTSSRDRSAASVASESVSQVVDAQQDMMRIGAEWMHTWMGMMGAFAGGMARMADSATDAARASLNRVASPRDAFRAVSGAIDHSLQAFEEARAGKRAPDDRSC